MRCGQLWLLVIILHFTLMTDGFIGVGAVLIISFIFVDSNTSHRSSLRSRFDFVSELKSITDFLTCFVYATILILVGSNPLMISLNTLKFSAPYILFFLAGILTWSIHYNNDNHERISIKKICTRRCLL